MIVFEKVYEAFKKMLCEKIGRLKVVYHPEDQDTADVIEGACEKALELANSAWGLTAPEHCAIYVVTSWWESVFRPASWPWRIVFAANLPIWIWRVRRTWSYAAGWTQRYGRRVAIGIDLGTSSTKVVAFDLKGNAFPFGTAQAREFITSEYEGYAQDTFHLKSNLTLTFGLRYSYGSVPYEKSGLEVVPNLDLAGKAA